MEKDHYRKLERMYLGAKINRQVFPSTQINISKGRAQISIDIRPEYFHALNALHGSVYFKLLDDAAFFAANSIELDFFVLTAHFEISFLRPVFEGKITATGTYLGIDGKFIKAESTLVNQDGKMVARGSGLFAKSKTQLSEVTGYR